jgi:hypothetical protein
MPDLPAGGWLLRAQVPDGTFTLALEADDTAAAAEHAAFADRCQPLLLRAVGGDTEEATWLRDELTGQLDALRRTVAASGLGYLGALAGEQHGRPVLILLAIAATSQVFPDGIDPASLLAAMLRRQYPEAAVEEFETAQGVGVGIRRCEESAVPSPAPDMRPLVIDAGISQALVPFPEAGLLGTAAAFCNPADIDVATVFTATIAHHLTVVPHGLTAALPGWHGNDSHVRRLIGGPTKLSWCGIRRPTKCSKAANVSASRIAVPFGAVSGTAPRADHSGADGAATARPRYERYLREAASCASAFWKVLAAVSRYCPMPVRP